LSGVQLVIEPRGYDDPVSVRLVGEVQQEYVELYGGPDEAAVDPAEFVPPHGLFLVGLVDGAPMASGGWRRLDDERVEIKRMYVARPARRQGFSRRMLAALEDAARAAGARRAVLNTGPMQPEAIKLYETSGYEPIPGFGHYAEYPDAVFFGKDL
jgi:GNAT superfamily N-acetyltransferase